MPKVPNPDPNLVWPTNLEKKKPTDDVQKKNTVSGPGRQLQAQATITSPLQNAKVGTSFTITGTASLEVLEDRPEGPHKSPGDGTADIHSVTVRVGDANKFQVATATGPTSPGPGTNAGTARWATWSYKANTTVQGPQTITAAVSVDSQTGDRISKRQHTITVYTGAN